jgi:hypothetical protein
VIHAREAIEAEAEIPHIQKDMMPPQFFSNIISFVSKKKKLSNV